MSHKFLCPCLVNSKKNRTQSIICRWTRLCRQQILLVFFRRPFLLLGSFIKDVINVLIFLTPLSSSLLLNKLIKYDHLFATPPLMDDVFYEQSLMQIKPQWDCKNHYHLRNYAPDKTYFPYSTWPHELHNVHGISVAVIVLLGIFPEVKETQLRSA